MSLEEVFISAPSPVGGQGYELNWHSQLGKTSERGRPSLVERERKADHDRS